MPRELIISASILAADFARLGEEVLAVIEAGVDEIHFDVMDNHFVPNLTVGPTVCGALRAYLDKHRQETPIDVHLMVTPVERLIREFAAAGAASISIHPEATENCANELALIGNLGCEVGVVLNPDRSPDFVRPYLNQVDRVLLMSVYPGFGGQAFLEGSEKRIEEVAKLCRAHARSIVIAVDGGVGLNNIHRVTQAGANSCVVGSALFSADNYSQRISELRQAAESK